LATYFLENGAARFSLDYICLTLTSGGIFNIDTHPAVEHSVDMLAIPTDPLVTTDRHTNSSLFILP